MSAAVASPRSSIRSAWTMYGTSKRFTTKPGVSLHATGVLPQASPNARAAAKDSSDVAGVRTTSTRRMSCTGLKKWSPTTCAGRPEALAHSAIGNDDVFEARIENAVDRKGTRLNPSHAD